MDKNNKKLTGCIFLNRSYVKWQHALVLDLKKRYGVEKWCGYGYGRAAAEINKTQNDIKYEPLLIDDYLFLEAKNEIVDEEFLNQKEKEYGHPYWWQEFINDRFTSINWPRQFYPVFNPTLNHYEIKQQFQYRIKKIEEMLDSVKPDFVLFADAGALGVNLLYYIAKKRGIQTIVLSFTRFSGLAGVTDNLYGMFTGTDIIFNKIREGNYISPKKKEAENWIEKFRNRPAKPEYMISEFWNKSKQNLVRQLELFFKNFVRKCIDSFDKSFPNVYNYSPLDFVRHSFLFWKNSRLTPKFDQVDYTEDYVFFGLTCEPELSLLMQAPYFSDQAWVVRMIAESLPLTYKLYVKEHPNMLGYRNPKFYKEIRKFPNIKLIQTEADSIELIKHSKLVTTITGTIGFEALFFKKPVITFGTVNYNTITSIRKCHTPDDLPLIVNDALENHKHNEEEFLDFVSALLEDSFKVDITKLISETDIKKIIKNPDIVIISNAIMKSFKSRDSKN